MHVALRSLWVVLTVWRKLLATLFRLRIAQRAGTKQPRSNLMVVTFLQRLLNIEQASPVYLTRQRELMAAGPVAAIAVFA